METIDFAKSLKDLYSATKKIKHVNADTGTFFAVISRGRPGGDAFQEAFQALYPTVYTVKFTVKSERKLDFKVCKPECVYLSDPHKVPMEEWDWQLMVRVPDEIKARDLTAAKKAILEKKGLDASAVKRIRWKGGRALQVLHVGPYEKLGETYQKLEAFAEEQGLQAGCYGQEIYLSDPRRTAPEKLKTIARLGVRKR